MKCEKCNVSINFKTNVCPLCHERLDTTDEAKQEIKKLERAYPLRNLDRPLAFVPFNQIFLIILLNITIICAILNFIFTPDIYWTIVVVAVTIYIYTFTKGTMMKSRRFSARVVGNAIALFIICFIVQGVIHKNLWIYEYLLPIIALSSMVIIAVYILMNLKLAGRFVSSLFSVAILGTVPVIVVVAMDDLILWPSLTVAVIGGCIIITSLILGGRSILNDIKRLIHM